MKLLKPALVVVILLLGIMSFIVPIDSRAQLTPTAASIALIRDSSITGIKIAPGAIDSIHINPTLYNYIIQLVGDSILVDFISAFVDTLDKYRTDFKVDTTNLHNSFETYIQNHQITYVIPEIPEIPVIPDSVQPGGSDTYVQFNDGGYFGGDDGFTYSKSVNDLAIKKITSIRFKGAYDSIYDVLSDDGTTQSTNMIVFEPGTNDSINWLSAAQGFKLSSGTKIIMPPDYQLELEKAAVRTSGSYGFYAEADSNIVIEGGIIDGNSAALHPYFNEWDHAFAFWDCDNIVIRNVTIKNMPGDGIYINNCTNVWIENCYIEVVNKQIGGGGAEFIGRNPISVIRGENIYIRNNTTVGGLPGGIVFETNNSPHHHFKNVYIVNNTVLDSDCHGINVTVGFGPVGDENYAEDIFVIGNSIKAPTGVGIGAFGDGEIHRMIVSYNTISDAECYNPYTGGSYETASSMRGNMIDCTFSNNIITDSKGFGFYFWSNYPLSVKNNKILGSDGYGIFVYKDNATIENNLIKLSGSHGIAVGGGIDDIRIINNEVCYNGKHGISLGGSSEHPITRAVVQDNDVYCNSIDSTGTYNGIECTYLEDSYISGNRCYDLSASPSQKYGIQFLNSSNCVFGQVFGFGNQSGILYRYKSNTDMLLPDARQIGTWYSHNLPNSTSAKRMELAGSYYGSVSMPFKGHLAFLTCWATPDVTYGEVTCRAVVNGTLKAVATLSLSNPKSIVVEIGDSPKEFLAGDIIHCEVSADSLAPADSIDVFAQIWVL